MAGNFPYICSRDGPQDVHAPLDINMNYVDWAYERALAMDCLPWLKERDEYTRTLMVSYLRSGYSQGTALKQALSDTTFEWKDSRLFKTRDRPIRGAGTPNSPSGVTTPAAGAGGAGGRGGGGGGGNGSGAIPQSPRGSKRKRQAERRQQAAASASAAVTPRAPPPPPAPQGGGQRNQQKTAELAPGGRKLCKAWGLGRCADRNCQLVHNYCARRLVGGGVCGKNHPQFKCMNPKRVK